MSDVEDPADQSAIESRSNRLREALSRAGGAAAVAKRINMPATTISNYVAGRDLKASALVALAEGCGVSIEWLATGKGAPAKRLDVDEAQPLGDISNALDAPVNFYLLALVFRACKEFFEREGLAKPTLRVALGWIGGPYSLHGTIDDIDFQIVRTETPDE